MRNGRRLIEFEAGCWMPDAGFFSFNSALRTPHSAFRNSHPQLRQQLRFRPGHQHVFIHRDFQPAEASRADDLLQRLALTASRHHFPEVIQLLGRQDTVEIEIQIHPLQMQQMRQQQLHLQARRFDLFLGQKRRATLYSLQYSHLDTISLKPWLQSAKYAGNHSFGRKSAFGSSLVRESTAIQLPSCRSYRA